jgi:hypothetical protein
MANKIAVPSFSDALAALAGHQFDVAEARNGAASGGGAGKAARGPAKGRDGAGAKAYRVQKYGCAAEIAAAPDGTTMVLKRPGWLLGGEIARLVDRGYQKFLKTTKMEIPATADHLHAIHEFSEELKKAAGATELYNQALGTTSDKYLYDRVGGRE